MTHTRVKAAKYEAQKLFREDVSRFSPCVINLLRNKNVCCRLKKVDVKSRTKVYYKQQIFIFVARFSSNIQLVMQQICSCATLVEGFCISYFATFAIAGQ